MISIIIPIKNEIEHIEECLNSLENQNFPDYEVIFADGRSTDGTREFLERQIKEKPHFSLLDNPNGDAASGRNIGIKEAKGDLIAFIDADAFADREWLKNIASRFAQIKDKNIAGVSGPILAPSNQSVISNTIVKVMASPLATGGKLNPSTQHIVLKKEKIVRHIPTGNSAFKNEIFKRGFLFDENFKKGHDFEFSIRLVKNGYRFFYDPKIRVWHYENDSIQAFTNQIFKWGVGRTLLVKKHRSHFVVFLPLLALVFFLLIFFISFFISGCRAVILGMLSLYIFFILCESVRISSSNLRMFPLATLLFVLLHISYTLGLIKGLFKNRNPWS